MQVVIIEYLLFTPHSFFIRPSFIYYLFYPANLEVRIIVNATCLAGSCISLTFSIILLVIHPSFLSYFDIYFIQLVE